MQRDPEGRTEICKNPQKTATMPGGTCIIEKTRSRNPPDLEVQCAPCITNPSPDFSENTPRNSEAEKCATTRPSMVPDVLDFSVWGLFSPILVALPDHSQFVDWCGFLQIVGFGSGCLLPAAQWVHIFLDLFVFRDTGPSCMFLDILDFSFLLLNCFHIFDVFGSLLSYLRVGSWSLARVGLVV